VPRIDAVSGDPATSCLASRRCALVRRARVTTGTVRCGVFTKPDQDFFRTQRHDKPWGHEILWAWGDAYVGKILHVRKGESLSLQYHREKDETMSVLTGRVRLETGAREDDLVPCELGPGDCVRLRPGTIHRLEALEDADVLEASTPQLADVVRLKDRYGR
jgi:mannose-6-phosphate isomerase